ncbi:MAG TPA: zf-HC2 domain-containing protein [Armatimonadota bacterium]|nr:zf-HC2 domain-containing protein [Armatimonadota bacterium]
MKCSHCESLTSAYLDGELAEAQMERVREHLASCPRCAEDFNLLRRSVRLVGHLGQESCPVDLRASIAAAIPSARRERYSLSPRRFVPLWGGAVAGMAALVAAATLLHVGEPQPSVTTAQAIAIPAATPEGTLHEQYDLATGLGTADGLLLSIPAEARAVAPGIAPNPSTLETSTN